MGDCRLEFQQKKKKKIMEVSISSITIFQLSKLLIR